MYPEVISTLETVVVGASIGLGISVTTMNTVLYFATKDFARRQEPWNSEEFQEKCENYWKIPVVKEEILKKKGLRAKATILLMNSSFKPGMYLACKKLSHEGYREPENHDYSSKKD